MLALELSHLLYALHVVIDQARKFEYVRLTSKPVSKIIEHRIPGSPVELSFEDNQHPVLLAQARHVTLATLPIAVCPPLSSFLTCSAISGTEINCPRGAADANMSLMKAHLSRIVTPIHPNCNTFSQIREFGLTVPVRNLYADEPGELKSTDVLYHLRCGFSLSG